MQSYEWTEGKFEKAKIRLGDKYNIDFNSNREQEVAFDYKKAADTDIYLVLKDGRKAYIVSISFKYKPYYTLEYHYGAIDIKSRTEKLFIESSPFLKEGLGDIEYDPDSCHVIVKETTFKFLSKDKFEYFMDCLCLADGIARIYKQKTEDLRMTVDKEEVVFPFAIKQLRSFLPKFQEMHSNLLSTVTKAVKTYDVYDIDSNYIDNIYL